MDIWSFPVCGKDIYAKYVLKGISKDNGITYFNTRHNLVLFIMSSFIKVVVAGDVNFIIHTIYIIYNQKTVFKQY